MGLKELLGEELFNQLSEDQKATKIVTYTGEQAPVPYERFKTVNDDKVSLTESVTTLQGQLKEFDNLKDIDPVKYEKMTTDIETLQTSLADKEKDFNTLQKNGALDKLFVKNQIKPNMAKLLRASLNVEDLELDGESFKGFEDTLKGWQTEYPEAFGKVKIEGENLDNSNGGNVAVTKEQWANMDYTERSQQSDDVIKEMTAS